MTKINSFDYFALRLVKVLFCLIFEVLFVQNKNNLILNSYLLFFSSVSSFFLFVLFLSPGSCFPCSSRATIQQPKEVFDRYCIVRSFRSILYCQKLGSFASSKYRLVRSYCRIGRKTTFRRGMLEIETFEKTITTKTLFIENKISCLKFLFSSLHY